MSCQFWFEKDEEVAKLLWGINKILKRILYQADPADIEDIRNQVAEIVYRTAKNRPKVFDPDFPMMNHCLLEPFVCSRIVRYTHTVCLREINKYVEDTGRFRYLTKSEREAAPDNNNKTIQIFHEEYSTFETGRSESEEVDKPLYVHVSPFVNPEDKIVADDLENKLCSIADSVIDGYKGAEQAFLINYFYQMHDLMGLHRDELAEICGLHVTNLSQFIERFKVKISKAAKAKHSLDMGDESFEALFDMILAKSDGIGVDGVELLKYEKKQPSHDDKATGTDK